MSKLKTKSKEIKSLVPEERKPYSSFREARYQEGRLNDYQEFLYKRAIYGLSVYTESQIKKMHWDKRRRITKIHKHTQDVLNVWKQKIITQETNDFMTSLFPNSSLVKDLVENYSDPDLAYKCNVSLESLGIEKKDIVKKLLKEGVLPDNFAELEEL